MPTGPNGEKRPNDVAANAVHVMKIATGEIEEAYEAPRRPPGRPRKSPPQKAAQDEKRRKSA